MSKDSTTLTKSLTREEALKRHNLRVSDENND